MRTRWIPVLLAATSLMAACGESETTVGISAEGAGSTAAAESQALTEEEGRELDRSFAATDLRLELDATVDGATIVVTGVVTNIGGSDSSGVRVSVEVGAGLAPPDPLGTSCVIDNGVMDCLVHGTLAVAGSSPHRPQDEVAEFQLVMPIDHEVLADDREVTLTAVVTARNLDLDNDTDPLNNTAIITLVVPAS